MTFLFVAIVGMVCFILGWAGRSMINMPSFKRATLASHRKVDNEYELTLSDGNVYRGDCTVWHSYPSGARPGTRKEGKLCDMWKRIKWEEPTNRRMGFIK